MLYRSTFNIGIRGLTLLSRFALVFAIAKFLSVSELGTYSIFTTTVSISILLLGIDFYMYSNREIIKSEKEDILNILVQQFLLFTFIYILILPSFYFLFFLNVLPFQYVGFFFIIVILEHISQEFFRIYSSLQKPIKANLILFIRSGLWSYVVIAIFFVSNDYRNLKYIWISWLIGSFVSILVSVYGLKNYFRYFKRVQVNFKWIRKGIKKSIPFFLATLCLKIVEYSDRYFLKYYLGDEAVGIYTFYFNIANVIPVFVFTGVSMFLYPKLIKYHQRSEMVAFKKTTINLAKSSIVATVSLAFILVVSIDLIIFILGKSSISDNINLFYIMLITMLFIVLGQIPHYVLYAQQRDKQILFSTMWGVIINITCNVLFIPNYGVYGAAISGNLSFLGIALFKFMYILNRKK